MTLACSSGSRREVKQQRNFGSGKEGRKEVLGSVSAPNNGGEYPLSTPYEL